MLSYSVCAFFVFLKSTSFASLAIHERIGVGGDGGLLNGFGEEVREESRWLSLLRRRPGN